MEVHKILNSSYLDILFDGRNKRYGGYELRKNYTRRLSKVLTLLLGVATITTAYSFVPSDEDRVRLIGEDHGPVVLTQPPPIAPDRPVPPPPPPPPPPSVSPTVALLPPEIADDQDVRDADLMPTQTDLHDVNIGRTNEDGDPDAINANIIPSGGTPGGTGIVEIPKEETQAYIYVEVMPKASYNINEYLAKNVMYPREAVENNIEGKVLVNFVVDKEGNITDVKIVSKKTIGGGLEDEAMRVIRSMPKWKPGMQNGIPVSVYFTIPVTFELQ